MMYRWSKINGISITSVGVALVIFAIWAMFITTAPQEQFQQDSQFARQYMEYYQGLTAFGSAMIIIGGFLYFLHRRSLGELERKQSLLIL
ncbi:MAG: hypothetical protein ACE5KA_07015 [Nitrososphaerales archaeon]